MSHHTLSNTEHFLGTTTICTVMVSSAVTRAFPSASLTKVVGVSASACGFCMVTHTFFDAVYDFGADGLSWAASHFDSSALDDQPMPGQHMMNDTLIG